MAMTSYQYSRKVSYLFVHEKESVYQYTTTVVVVELRTFKGLTVNSQSFSLSFFVPKFLISQHSVLLEFNLIP